MQFKGRTALVTGSTSGIGLGIAHALAKEGANVIVNGLASDAGGRDEFTLQGRIIHPRRRHGFLEQHAGVPHLYQCILGPRARGDPQVAPCLLQYSRELL